MFGGELGFWEIVIILIAGVVLFGKSLPDVGRSLGRALAEFKKGLKGLEDTLDSSLGGVRSTLREATNLNMARPERPDAPPHAAPAAPKRVVTTAPKFQDEPIDVPT